MMSVIYYDEDHEKAHSEHRRGTAHVALARKEFGIPRDHPNVNGSTARSPGRHFLHIVRNRGAGKGVASACLGGGEATAIAIETSPSYFRATPYVAVILT
jgi:hypothetical protein